MEINVVKSHYYHEDTELRLGLPGSNKRKASDVSEESTSGAQNAHDELAPSKKVQAIGWPPVRSYRKNLVKATRSILVKVSMDGAPYLRKIDLNLYKGYSELQKALEDMFDFKRSEYEASYEDKDGDLMLVGDVPWQMFTTSCKRLRIIKRSGLKELGTLA